MLYRSHTLVAIFCAFLFLCAQGFAAPSETDEPEHKADTARDREHDVVFLSAPVVYKDVMLIASSSNGVAAIVFGGHVETKATLIDARRYQFRFLPTDGGNEVAGAGVLYDPVNPHFTPTESDWDDKNACIVKAGDIRLEWSAGNDDRGWVYYRPETIRLQVVHRKHFEGFVEEHIDGGPPWRCKKVDLKRFIIQPWPTVEQKCEPDVQRERAVTSESKS